MEQKEYKKLTELINNQTSVLVGVLCKRIEVLEKQKLLIPELYKAIVKEIIYEQSRTLKTLIKVQLVIGKLIFKTRPKE